MSVASQYPMVRDSNGREWYRPVRPAGADLSQWGWTSLRELAHPDYRQQADEAAGGLHPERLCGGDCSGCVSEGEGAAPYPVRPTGFAALVAEREAPVVAAVAERAEVFGGAWSQVARLAAEAEAIAVGNDVERIPQATELLALLDESTGLW
ncbi:hypothetical protein I5H03_gp026 [Mycobacterium phage Nibb]|uniref:Uncharacterized protein n=1 Tax=Mycobacterium phage Nibb TaxID=2510585 RepID=A0A411B5K3_9CAUD|nr:hypothetical protein I5H03_gp026 [Mycobacterium phage Nibb]QAX95620.1 hypothetical protein SEA_NIBB_81 [Mycobacterium phage Nibb]